MEREPVSQRAVAFLVGAATENWGTKLLALLLALAVFVGTRDEVERTFTVPLAQIDDPDRKLLTELPGTVEVTLRGPWANVNRLDAVALGSATLDLREARPGPLVLDPAAVVMPRGVVLHELDYAPVDLRFEPILERRVPIAAAYFGEVDPDYTLDEVRVEPDSWVVRGTAEALEGVPTLSTESVDLGGARGPRVTIEAELINFEGEVTLAGARAGRRPKVRVVAWLEPVEGERELDVPTGEILRDAVPKFADVGLPDVERVTLRGPKSALRRVAAVEDPLIPIVEVEPGAAGRRTIPLTLRFAWSSEVREADSDVLRVEPPVIRLRVSSAGVLDSPAEMP